MFPNGSKHKSINNAHGVSLSSLSSDVLIMIFENLDHMSPRKFFRLRLDSNQFDALVVPIIYRHLVLTKAVVAYFGKDVDDEAQLQMAQDVPRYSKAVGIDDYQLNWHMVGELLSSVRDLRYLSWSIMEPYSDSVFEGSSRIFPILRQRWPHAKLALAASTHMLENMIDFPLLQLASFKVVDNSKAGYLDQETPFLNSWKLVQNSSDSPRRRRDVHTRRDSDTYHSGISARELQLETKVIAILEVF